eukprot:gene13787-biopygen6865
MLLRDQQTQFLLLLDAWVESYNKTPDGGSYLPFLREAGAAHYDVMRVTYNSWAQDHLNLPISDLPDQFERHTDLAILQCNAYNFWTGISSGQLPMGLGQPPDPDITVPIVPVNEDWRLSRRSNSWSRTLVPWGPQPLPLLAEDVYAKKPELPHMLIHHLYGDYGRKGKPRWLPYEHTKTPEDFRSKMSYEELKLARRFVAAYTLPQLNASKQPSLRPYTFHSTSFLDGISGPRMVPSDILLASKSIPAHVIHSPRTPGTTVQQPPPTRNNSPITQRVLSVSTTSDPNVATTQTTVEEPATAEISPTNAVLFDIAAYPDTVTVPNFTLPRVSGTLPPHIIARFQALLAEFQHVFIRDFSGPPWTSHLHEIRLEPGARPRGRAPLRIPQAHLAVLQATLDKWLEEGVVSPSESPWAAPAFFVPKPDGSLRLVIDYRYLNSQTIPDRFPLPLPEDLLGRLHGAESFSSFDAHSGFTQQARHPNSRHLTTFNTPMGLFQFTRLSMGLRNDPASFSRGMSFMSHDLPGMLVYLDDVN